MAGGHIVHKEMGYTQAEFLRLLPKALGSGDANIDGNRIELRQGTTRLSIELGPESERRLGNFRLPVLPVRIEFSGYRDTEIETALARFWRTYQKGGG